MGSGGITKIVGQQDEVKKRDERISALEQQLKESTARYDKLFIARSGGMSGTTTQYKIDKQGKRVSDIKTIPTRRSSGSTGTNLKIQGTGTNLG
jgi:predicted RNase H-like nuclease (RuvC/YqgF family)